MVPSVRSRRIDVRVTDTQDAVIREAAALAGQTVTAFLLSAAEDRARALVDARRHQTMSTEAFARLTAQLDEPRGAVPELVELFERPRIPEE